MSKAPTQKKRPLYSEEEEKSRQSLLETAIQGSEAQIFISSPIHDRQSTFIAHFHPASSVFANRSSSAVSGQKSISLTATVKRLQSHPSFSDASHRIVAWRKRSSQQTITATTSTLTSTSTPVNHSKPVSRAVYTTSSDDDGEKYAGKRLEKVLAETDVQGVLVVARWYGGVLLGPVRFTHIETCAGEAIRKWRAGLGDVQGDAGGAKRQKMDADAHGSGLAKGDDEAERSRLVEQLAERDNSITVLREFLAEKTRAKTTYATGNEKVDPSQQPSSTASPAKKIDYSEMAFAKLKQLEKARDATIAFILKQLDKVEEEEKVRGNRDGQQEGQAPAVEEDHSEKVYEQTTDDAAEREKHDLKASTRELRRQTLLFEIHLVSISIAEHPGRHRSLNNYMVRRTHQADTNTSSWPPTFPTPLALLLAGVKALRSASSSLNLSTTIFLVSCW